jgi:hypothetical protein
MQQLSTSGYCNNYGILTEQRNHDVLLARACVQCFVHRKNFKYDAYMACLKAREIAEARVK